MDQTAIKQIQDTAIAAVANESIKSVITPIVLVPEKYSVQSLEKFGNAPVHHIERFKTKYLGEFFSYARENATDNMTVFVSEEPMSATAIFDRSSYDAPSWQYHRAILELENTPALDALLGSNNKNFSQQELLDFVIDWSDNIQFYSGDEALNFGDALARIRKLRITQTQQAESERGDFAAKKSAFDQIEIDAAGLPLPSHFVFTTPPYLQFKARSYTAQIRALGDENKPQLKYRLMGLPAIKQEIAEEFKDSIIDELVHATIYIGTI